MVEPGEYYCPGNQCEYVYVNFDLPIHLGAATALGYYDQNDRLNYLHEISRRNRKGSVIYDPSTECVISTHPAKLTKQGIIDYDENDDEY